MTTKRNILTATLAFAFLAGMGTLPTATATFDSTCEFNHNAVQPVQPVPVGPGLVISGVLTPQKTEDAYYVVLPAATEGGSGIVKWDARLLTEPVGNPDAATLKAQSVSDLTTQAASCTNLPSSAYHAEPFPFLSGVYLTPDQQTIQGVGAGVNGFVLSMAAPSLTATQAIAYSIVIVPCDSANTVCGA